MAGSALGGAMSNTATRGGNATFGQGPSGGKGGAQGNQGQRQITQPGQAQYAPLAPQGNFNVNQAAAGGLQQAMQGTQAGMGFQAERAQASGYRPSAMTSRGYNAQGYDAQKATAQGYDAQRAGSQGYTAAQVGPAPTISADQVRAGQLAGRDLGAYTNQYETQVVDQTLSDLGRSRDMALDQQSASATAANAFGGSRHGIAESETQRAFAEQAARSASGLRQAGFTQAQQMAQQDIGTAQQAALANQQANLQADTTTGQFSQQSALANQSALNQASQFGAGASNQAALANALSGNQASQFGAGAQNVASTTNAAAQNAASQFGAGAQNASSQFGASAANLAASQNMDAQNQAAQFGAGAQNQMAIANQNAGMNANQQRLSAASQLGSLGQQAFNTGQTIQNSQMQQGLMQQGISQALIDAARGQYAGYTGAPMSSLSAPLAALGATPNQSTTTQSQSPGLFNYLGLALGASDVRLKDNIVPAGELNGVKFYNWDWNDEGKRIANPDQPTFGVIADELQETHPHLVQRGEDGYLRVNYTGLTKELEAA